MMKNLLTIIAFFLVTSLSAQVTNIKIDDLTPAEFMASLTDNNLVEGETYTVTFDYINIDPTGNMDYKSPNDGIGLRYLDNFSADLGVHNVFDVDGTSTNMSVSQSGSMIMRIPDVVRDFPQFRIQLFWKGNGNAYVTDDFAILNDNLEVNVTDEYTYNITKLDGSPVIEAAIGDNGTFYDKVSDNQLEPAKLTVTAKTIFSNDTQNNTALWEPFYFPIKTIDVPVTNKNCWVKGGGFKTDEASSNEYDAATRTRTRVWEITSLTAHADLPSSMVEGVTLKVQNSGGGASNVENDNVDTFIPPVNGSGNQTNGYTGGITHVLVGDYTVLSSPKISISNIKIYPNPTTGLLHITDVTDMQSISILNLLGQNVKTLKAANTIDVSDLNKGIYFLSTDTGLTRKFIKE